MEVSYTTTIDDYVAYSLHSIKRSPSMRLRRYLGWLVIPIGCWIGAIFLAITDEWIAVLPAIFGVMYVMLYPLAARDWTETAVRTYFQELDLRGSIGRITLILADDTMTERTETVQSVARWRDMKGIEVVGDTTYIFVTGLQVAIIPRHGFERPEEYEAVRAFAVDKLENRREVPSPGRAKVK